MPSLKREDSKETVVVGVGGGARQSMPDVTSLVTNVRRTRFVNSQRKIRKGILRLEKVLMDKYILLNRFTEPHEDGQPRWPPKRRLVTYMLFNALHILVTLRFVVCTLVQREAVWILLGDPLYVSNDRIAFNFGIATMFLSAVMLRYNLFKGELTDRNYFLDDLASLYAGNDRKLSGRNFYKFARKLEAFLLVFGTISTWCCCLFPIICYTFFTYEAWRRGEYPYPDVSLVAAATGFAFGAFVASYTILLVLSLLFLSLSFIKLQLQQINIRAVRGMKCNHTITKCLNDHRQVSLRVMQYNKVFSRMLLSIYLCMTPAIDALLIMVFISNSFAFIAYCLSVVLLCASGIVFSATMAPALLYKEVDFFFLQGGDDHFLELDLFREMIEN